MTPELKARGRRLRDDFPYYADECLKIRTKAGAVERFRLNDAQRYLHGRLEGQKASAGKVRAMVLKGRQQGCSTYAEGRFFHLVTHRRGVKAFILTHMDDATNNLFGMAKRFYENCPEPVRPSLRASNAKELVFDRLDSGYKVGTAGSKGTGRGETIQLFHGCLGLDSLVVMADGRTKRLGDVQCGEYVVTHTMKHGMITYMSEQTKPTLRVAFKGLGDFPLVSTGEHRFWTREGWKELRAMEVGECVGFPVPAVSQAVPSLPFKAKEIARPQGGGKREAVPDAVVPDYDLGRIVGLYLAEGCIVRQAPQKGRRPSAVCFAVHENEVERTAEWLKPLSRLYTSVRIAARPGSKTVTVTAYGRSFAEWMESLVGSKDDKRFPSRWSEMGEGFVRGLIHGYVSGDGHSSPSRDRRISVTSIRRATVIGLRSALAAMGYGWAGICHKAAAIRHGRNEREAWTLRLTGGGVEKLAAEIGKPVPPRKRRDLGNYGTVKVEDGYAWVPIMSIEDNGPQTVRDLEIGHDDHSYCVIQGATHNSEVAYWPNADTHVAGALQAVPDEPGTEIILESTSAGRQGLFYDMCAAAMRGEGEYILVFIPWFWQREYRKPAPDGFEPTADELAYADEHGLDVEQLAWRRSKIVELNGVHNFRREYPATPEEAFAAEVPGALWTRERIDDLRAADHPELKRIVVAIDPSGGDKQRNDEVGLVVVGMDAHKHGWVMADHSGRMSPEAWGSKAVALYRQFGADRIVAEANFGGAMVESTIRVVDRSAPVKLVHASRGKHARAEPVAALYETGRMHHVGTFVGLEDEMVTWVPSESTDSPNRVDALVWAATELLIDGPGGARSVSLWNRNA